MVVVSSPAPTVAVAVARVADAEDLAATPVAAAGRVSRSLAFRQQSLFRIVLYKRLQRVMALLAAKVNKADSAEIPVNHRTQTSAARVVRADRAQVVPAVEAVQAA